MDWEVRSIVSISSKRCYMRNTFWCEVTFPSVVLHSYRPSWVSLARIINISEHTHTKLPGWGSRSTRSSYLAGVAELPGWGRQPTCVCPDIVAEVAGTEPLPRWHTSQLTQLTILKASIRKNWYSVLIKICGFPNSQQPVPCMKEGNSYLVRDLSVQSLPLAGHFLNSSPVLPRERSHFNILGKKHNI